MDPRASRPLNILFVMGRLGHVRFYLSSLELLLDRGHNVQLLIEKGGWGPAEQRWLDERGKRPNFGWEHARNYDSDPWHRRSLDLRRGLGHIYFFGPAFRSRPRYRRRALRSGSPTSIRRIAALPVVRSARGLRLLYGTVSAAERSMPLPKPVDDCMSRYRPDVVVLGNYNRRHSHFASFVRLARKDGIPVIALVASWDNLSTRPPMHRASAPACRLERDAAAGGGRAPAHPHRRRRRYRGPELRPLVRLEAAAARRVPGGRRPRPCEARSALGGRRAPPLGALRG